jgi:hypothetical protein
VSDAPVLDELRVEPRVFRRLLPRRRRGRIMLTLVTVAALCVGGWWLGLRALNPILDAEQLPRVYDPPPEPDLGWDEPAPMTTRPSELPGGLAWLGPAACREAAAALFNYLPRGSVDGALASFGTISDTRFGVSATSRYRSPEAAAAAFRDLTRDLDACDHFALPVQYGSILIDIEEHAVTQSYFGGSRARYTLTTTTGPGDQFSSLVGLQVGNTVTWQTRNPPDQPTTAERDAEKAWDALLSRVRAVS